MFFDFFLSFGSYLGYCNYEIILKVFMISFSTFSVIQ